MPKALLERKIKGLFERPSGSGIWWIDYSVNGTRVREKIGGKAAALKAYDKRRAEAWVSDKIATRKSVTFGVLVEDALEHSRQRKLRDMKTITNRLTRLKAEFGDKAADTITPAVIDAWLSDNTRSPATSNRFKAAFSKVFKLAVRNNKVQVNPATKVEPQKEENGRIRWMARGSKEEQRLHEAVLKLYPQRLPELTISMGTGMRLSEQYTLIWKEVDFDAGQNGYIRLSKTKNGSHRDIPMSPGVRLAFETIFAASGKPKPDEAVFSNKTPRKWFDAVLAEAQISDYTWHCNRHSFCSRLAKSGAHIRTIQQLAGHKTISMSARYTHLEDETVEAAVMQLV